jgi:hypothetical protein
VENKGNVTVNDATAGVTECVIASLAVGSSPTCTATGTAQEGQCNNLGTVNGQGSQGRPVLAGIAIDDNTAHTFKADADGSLIRVSTRTVYKTKEYKQICGFGGLVYEQVSRDTDRKPVLMIVSIHNDLRGE